MSTLDSSGFLVLRTPLLPFDEFQDWARGITAHEALDDPGKLADALKRDRVVLREHLKRFVDRPEVREAMLIASPSFDQSLQHWLDAPDSEKGRRVEASLVRYFTRAVSRCTPFGLFAGYSVGRVAGETNLALAARSDYIRHTRLAMYYLITLADAIARDPAYRGELRYRPNSSLYRAAGRMRYIETRVSEAGQSFQLVAAEPSEYLDLVLESAAEGALPGRLAELLVASDPEIAPAEAEAYVEELVESQLLVPELGPAITGAEAAHGLLAQLRSYPHLAQLADQLEEAQVRLEAIDARGLGNPQGSYRAVADSIAALPGNLDAKELFQVNLMKPAPAATLGNEVLDEIRRGVELLHALARPARNESLSRFRREFEDRYGGREVCLVEALDEETGIGFGAASTPVAHPSPLLPGLALGTVPEEAASLGRTERLLLTLLERALLANAAEIQIEPEHIKHLGSKGRGPLPGAFTMKVAIAASSPEALAAGDYRIVLGGLWGPSGAELFGRFTQGDPELRELVRNHLRSEEAQRPATIFAEVVHSSEERGANVVSRAALRTHEIPFLGRSGAGSEQTIALTDLFVSVRAGRVVLRSRRLNREVLPRMSNAHNFSASRQGIYRFLCTLPYEDGQPMSQMLWGALERLPYLPRLVHGRFVISRAQWRADAQELAGVQQLSEAERFKAVQSWRRDRKLPRLVVVAEFDHELLVDLDNILSVESFLDLLKSRGGLVLTEMLPAEDELCVRGPEGRFVSELMIPFVQRRDPAAVTAGTAVRTVAEVPVESTLRRRCPPGSEWLFAKLYTGEATADQLLRGPIPELVERLTSAGAADRWFFIRYADPQHHLRIRFHGSPDQLGQAALPVLHELVAPLLEDGRVWRVELDTYEREVERYGGPEGMLLAERFFHADSDAVLPLMQPGIAEPTGDARWLVALAGVDLLLDGIGCDLGAKLRLCAMFRDAYGSEFAVGKPQTVQLGKKYREKAQKIEALLQGSAGQDEALSYGMEILRRRSKRLVPLFEELGELARAGRLSSGLDAWMGSLIHMHLNRMFQAAPREQELVLYDFLTRAYESRIGRARGAAVTNAAVTGKAGA